MAWGRLALIQVAGEDETSLRKTAKVFGFSLTYSDETELSLFSDISAFMQPSPQTEEKASRKTPARFLRVHKITQLEEQWSERPDYLNDPNMRLQVGSVTGGSYDFEPPRALLPMSRLMPFLRNSLGQARVKTGLDYYHLSRQIAQGKPLYHLPRLRQQRWPQKLQIIVDASTHLEPYWADFAFIVRGLKGLLGQESVESIRFDEKTLNSKNIYCISWPTQDKDEWHSWNVPSANAAILILSDFGVMEQRHGSAHDRWRRLGQRLLAYPEPLLTLSPASHSPANPRLCQQLKFNPLNDRHNLARHPARHGFMLDEPNTEKLHDILAFLSALPLIDTGLLRRLRDILNWGGSELESIVWNHPDIHRTSFGIRLYGSVVEKYRQRYQQKIAGTSEARRFWQALHQYHQQAHEGLRQLEKLNQCVLDGVEDVEVMNYFRHLCATTMQTGEGTAQRRSLALQCRTILASKPESIWISKYADIAYDLYALAHEKDVRAGKWPERLENGFDPSRLQWMLGKQQQLEQEEWQVIQTGDQGQFTLYRKQSGMLDSVPIATLESPKHFPPILKISPETIQTVQEGVEYKVPDNKTIMITTKRQALELGSSYIKKLTSLKNQKRLTLLLSNLNEKGFSLGDDVEEFSTLFMMIVNSILDLNKQIGYNNRMVFVHECISSRSRDDKEIKSLLRKAFSQKINSDIEIYDNGDFVTDSERYARVNSTPQNAVINLFTEDDRHFFDAFFNDSEEMNATIIHISTCFSTDDLLYKILSDRAVDHLLIYKFTSEISSSDVFWQNGLTLGDNISTVTVISNDAINDGVRLSPIMHYHFRKNFIHIQKKNILGLRMGINRWINLYFNAPSCFFLYVKDDGMHSYLKNIEKTIKRYFNFLEIDYLYMNIGGSCQNRLIAGDFVFCIISKKYLESFYPMLELLGILEKMNLSFSNENLEDLIYSKVVLRSFSERGFLPIITLDAASEYLDATSDKLKNKWLEIISENKKNKQYNLNQADHIYHNIDNINVFLRTLYFHDGANNYQNNNFRGLAWKVKKMLSLSKHHYFDIYREYSEDTFPWID